MPTILLDNDHEFPNQKKPAAATPGPVTNMAGNSNVENLPGTIKPDDFAIFPQWDVIPPNAIINPRIKKNI